MLVVVAIIYHYIDKYFWLDILHVSPIYFDVDC